MPGHLGRLRLPSLGADSNSGSNALSQLQKEHRRVVLMGSARVGKSSIISQFLYDKYLTKYRETVEELHRGEYELQDGASLTLDILDTSGAFQFPAMRALSISTADAFILVFSVDKADSWDEVKRLREQKWLHVIRHILDSIDTAIPAHAGSIDVKFKGMCMWSEREMSEIVQARGSRVPIVIVGNKIDLGEKERQVPREISKTTAAFDWECGYVECSAKDNAHIIDVFKELLVQAKIRYNLSPAVRRRRQSLPNYVSGSSSKSKPMLKRNSCSVA